MTKAQANKIKTFAKNYYNKSDQTHGLEHLDRTVKLAIFLARKEKADIQVVKFGAMLHQLHNGKTVLEFLRKIRLDSRLAGQIAHCVECSSRKNVNKAKTIEAKIVFDADKLQLIGPFGIAREISHCMVPPISMGFREALKHTKEIEQECFKALQTRTARGLAKRPHGYAIKFWRTFDAWDKANF